MMFTSVIGISRKPAMSTDQPLISIITASFNQGDYIRATIESVKSQNYPNIEHIIIDGGSTDNTLAVLAEYPHLTVISEPDNGHADAINKGFRMAKGSILGFLNSDDTLAEDALQAVADNIDPARDRHVVMGRCRFIDEAGNPTGIEHPSYFVSHKRMLKIWQGHGIPQPSVFWTKEVWQQCGPMVENLGLPWIDYDFFCRVSMHYDFYTIDKVLSCYRMQPSSITVGSTEQERLEESITISRRYWGSPLSFKHISLTLSLARFRFDRIGKARNLILLSQQSFAQKKRLKALVAGTAAVITAPIVSMHYLAFPLINRQALSAIRRIMLYQAHRRQSSMISAYKGHTDLWDDNWAGPQLIMHHEITEPAEKLIIQGSADVDCLCEDLKLRITVNTEKQGEFRISENGQFEIIVPLTTTLPPASATVEIETKQWFVMDGILHNGDTRPLSWKLNSINFVCDTPSTPDSRS